MHKEISQLEALKCWDEVDISDAKTRIIPSTWVFKIKQSPDGEIKKYKAHFCCHRHLQEDVFESFTPVVSWTSICLFLVLTAILGWATCSLVFTNAFAQVTLPSPVWLHLPQGYRSAHPGKTYLCLKKSQYGLTITWVQETGGSPIGYGLHHKYSRPMPSLQRQLPGNHVCG